MNTIKTMDVKITEVEVQRLYTTKPVYYMHYVQNGVERKNVLPIHLDFSLVQELVKADEEWEDGQSYTFTTEYLFEKLTIDFKEQTATLTMVNRFGVKSSLEVNKDEFNNLVHMLVWLEIFDKNTPNRIGIVYVESESIETILYKVKTFAEDSSIKFEQIRLEHLQEVAM
ncbi:hypothetical protein [Bacillus bombysepticus]|uniref:hypothetical protein n=1 Tax=Bacillus bombysepticus TaxID=658666 RepID=UPI00301B417F